MARSVQQEPREGGKNEEELYEHCCDTPHLLGSRAARPFGDFTTALVVEFRNTQRDEGKAPATVNKALSVVRQICDEAISAGVLMEHPFAVHGKRLTLPRNTKARKRKHFKSRSSESWSGPLTPKQFSKTAKNWRPHGKRSLSFAATQAGDSKSQRS